MWDGVWYSGAMVVDVGDEEDCTEHAVLNDPLVSCRFKLIGEKDEGLEDPSKSQETPCLRQFPHVGWTSSHYAQVRRMTSSYTIYHGP
jgi:hypothetical protein